MALFQIGDFTLASGQRSRWKIECDSLTPEDWEALALMSLPLISNFGRVFGVPTGGFPFARALEQYATSGPCLVVDDVYTTGRSLREVRVDGDLALVAFARHRPPPDVKALFICQG